jgi:nucleotide-binding universal stress UspA family protein
MGIIVLTTDLSDESRRAYAPTVKLARMLDMRIALLHVVPELTGVPHGAPLAPPVAPADIAADVRDAQARLDELAGRLGEGAAAEVIAATNVAEAIAAYAKRVGADFIALSTHGRTGVRRLVMGSVAEGVMRHASTPIICFPPVQA